jgi:hypothetical protein
MHPGAIAAIAGASGAAVLTLVHETGRHLIDDAPRMDVLGKRALRALRHQVGAAEVDGSSLHRQTLAGDLVANSLYYSLVGSGPTASLLTRGVTLGALAGIGALVLPRPMGLGDPPSIESHRNRVLTVAYYTLGGIVAAATARALRENASEPDDALGDTGYPRSRRPQPQGRDGW